MLRNCCPVQRGTLAAATRHIRSSASSFIQRVLADFPAPLLPAAFAGEGVASAAAAALAAFPGGVAARPWSSAAGGGAGVARACFDPKPQSWLNAAAMAEEGSSQPRGARAAARCGLLGAPRAGSPGGPGRPGGPVWTSWCSRPASRDSENEAPRTRWRRPRITPHEEDVIMDGT